MSLFVFDLFLNISFDTVDILQVSLVQIVFVCLNVLLDLLLQFNLISEIPTHVRLPLLGLTSTPPFTIPELLIQLSVDPQSFSIPINLYLLEVFSALHLVAKFLDELRFSLRFLDSIEELTFKRLLVLKSFAFGKLNLS